MRLDPLPLGRALPALLLVALVLTLPAGAADGEQADEPPADNAASAERPDDSAGGATAAGPADPDQMTRDERAAEYNRLQKDLAQAFRTGQYEWAAQICHRQMRLVPRYPEPGYNLACALTRQNRLDEAMAALARAVDLGWRDVEHLKKDPDLAALRENRAEKLAELLKNVTVGPGPAERARADQRIIEARPENGLAYRLLLSNKATAEKPHRLVVWMHPAGGSMNQSVQTLAPHFQAEGFALLLFTHKNFRGWSAIDAQRMLRTIETLDAVEGLDTRRPVVLGYSAGGQMGLVLWMQDPDRFGGLILDAAYPLLLRGRTWNLMALPEGKDLSVTPILAFIGGRDKGLDVWRKVEPDWRKRGIPLDIQVVGKLGHTWLIGREQFDHIVEWLKEIPAPGPAEGSDRGAQKEADAGSDGETDGGSGD